MSLRDVKVWIMFIQYKFNEQVKRYRKHNEKKVCVVFYRIRNWGDILNKHLLNRLKISHEIIDIDLKNKYLDKKHIDIGRHYLVVGSIVQHADENSVIWGAGYISDNSTIKAKPAEVLAVRGPLTRDRLISQDIRCPEVYGDPALLLPFIYENPGIKKYKLGVILHNDHNSNTINSTVLSDHRVIVINLRDDFLDVLNKIMLCENIVSSSLHGLIVADAYGIPSRRLVFNNKNLHGGDFKFMDYYLSIEHEPEESLIVNDKLSVEDFVASCNKKHIKLDLFPLIESCPFNSSELAIIKEKMNHR